MFQSLFSLSLSLSSIDKYFLQIFLSRYCSILIIVLIIHKYGIIWYRILFWIGISMIWNKTHVPVYSHFVVVAALHFISFLFQTLTLNSFSFSYYQSTILMSICIINFIVVAILMCLVVCWTWIDNSIQNRHRFNPSIMHSWDKNNSKWWMKEWLFVYNILVAEYQFVSYDNLIIVIHCIKWASFIHSCIDWFIDYSLI